MIILRNLIIFCLGLAIGYTFADIDLAPPLPVKHRSAWTHGLLIPALIWFVSWPAWAWYFWASFLPAYGIHLLKDMFPKAWKGGALIKLHPFPGRLPGFLSFAWIGAGMVGAFYAFYLLYWPALVRLAFFWR